MECFEQSNLQQKKNFIYGQIASRMENLSSLLREIKGIDDVIELSLINKYLEKSAEFRDYEERR